MHLVTRITAGGTYICEYLMYTYTCKARYPVGGELCMVGSSLFLIHINRQLKWQSGRVAEWVVLLA